MSSEEPTLAELWEYARSLRVMLPKDASLDEVRSLLAQKAKRMAKPTTDQIRLAREMGIRIDPTLYSGIYVKLLIQKGMLKAGEAILEANRALDDGNIIIYKGMPHKILSITVHHECWMVSLECLASGKKLAPIRLHLLSDVKLATSKDLENL